jgi:nicotinate dehydrogenase large molybdopterin subunit
MTLRRLVGESTMTTRSLAELRRAFAERPDANWKLAGGKGFLTDLAPADALVGHVWRSPVPHGRIRSIDTRAAAAIPGVARIVTATDVPGLNGFGHYAADQPVLCSDRVRMIGDPVAAVAAENADIAARAIAALKVEIEPMPLVIDPEAALGSDAVSLHPRGNLCHEKKYERGNIQAAFANCAFSFEDTYYTGRQLHIAMEVEGGYVVPEADGSFSIFTGSHFPHGDQAALAAIMAIEPSRIRVTASPMGGSFGGRDTLSVQPLLLLLAQLTGRPVKMQRSRAESMTCGDTRHPFRIRMRTGCDSAGRLMAHQVDMLADTGAYTTSGPEVLETSLENAQGPYDFAAVALSGRMVFTNNGNAGAFRGFGAVQAQFALERQIERLAALVGLQSARFRSINLRPIAEGPLGQITTGAQHPTRVLDAIAAYPLHSRLPDVSETRYVRGVGLSLITKGEGFGKGGPNAGSLSMSLAPTGKIVVAIGAVEMGQGAIAVGSEAAAKALGVAQTDIMVRLGLSRDPSAGPSAASRVAGVVYRGIRTAAPLLRNDLLHLGAGYLNRRVDELELGRAGIWEKGAGRNQPLLPFSELAGLFREALPSHQVEIAAVETPSQIKAHGDFNAAGAVASVLIDRCTGAIKVEHIAMAAACGPVISPIGFVGQVEGGAVMGLGMALLEFMPEDQGKYFFRNLDGYMVPSLIDAPVVDLIAIEDIDAGDNIGPRGIGEISLNVTVPAIANAVANALNAPVVRLPIRPADILAVLRLKEEV